MIYGIRDAHILDSSEQFCRQVNISPSATPEAGTPQSGVSQSTWNQALFGLGSAPSTPGSLSAAGAERSVPNLLYNLTTVDNPAFSSDAKPLNQRPSEEADGIVEAPSASSVRPASAPVSRAPQSLHGEPDAEVMSLAAMPIADDLDGQSARSGTQFRGVKHGIREVHLHYVLYIAKN